MKNILFLILLISHTAFTQVQVLVDTAAKKQRITGLGTCTDKKNIDAHINDLGSAMVRVSIVGTSGLETSQNDNSNPDSLDLSKFVWKQDIIDAAVAAHNANVKVIVNSFTPPAWMKTNANENEGGSVIGTMYNEFGEWALGCVKSFKLQAGFYPYSFGTQNEPDFWEPYPSCIFTPDQLMKATKAAGKRFALDSLPLKIFHGEALFTQSHVLSFCSTVNNDDTCKNFVQAFAIHISDNDGLNPGSTTSTYYTQTYNECQRVSPKKEFWLTENSASDGYKQNNALDMSSALRDACNYYNGLKYGNLNVWLFCANNTRTSMEVYYVNKQFIRFIRPGSVRMEASTNDKDILALAFRNDSLKSHTVVLINKGKTSKSVNMDLPGFTGSCDAYRTSAGEYCRYNGKSSTAGISLPAESVTTLVQVPGNALPAMNRLDTIVVLQNTTDKIALSGISDGGEGNQTVTFTVESQMPYFNSLAVNYSSPSTTGELAYSLKTGQTGSSLVYLTADDHSSAFDGMYSQYQQVFNFIVIPFINIAPFFGAIDDQTYTATQFNNEQLLSLQSISDGNGGKQTLSLSAVSSNPNVVSVTASGSGLLKLTPKTDGTVTITVTLKDNGDTYMEYKSGIRGVNSYTRTFTVVSGTGINSFAEPEPVISVYPNPAKGIFSIHIPERLMPDANLEIYNLIGLKLYITNITTNDQIITFSDQPGLYIIKIRNGKSYYVETISLQ